MYSWDLEKIENTQKRLKWLASLKRTPMNEYWYRRTRDLLDLYVREARNV